MNFITDIEDVKKQPNEYSVVENGISFEKAYNLATTLDSFLNGNAFEFSSLDELVEYTNSDKETFMDMLEMLDIDKEEIEEMSSSTGDDFTDSVDIISETLLDSFDDGSAPLITSVYMDYTFYPTSHDCKEGNSGNSPIHKGQTCKITAHRGKIGYKRDGRVNGNPYKKTAQKGTTKTVEDKDKKKKNFMKSMRKLGYFNNKGKQTKAYRKGLKGNSSTSSSQRLKD